LPGAHIISRDWDDVDHSKSLNGLGTYSGGQQLLTPLKGISSFQATFTVMFKEEFRKNVEFAKARQMVLFPMLLALVTMVSTVGLQFLVGDSAAQTTDTDANSFTWQELRFALHLPLLMFSLGMGTFAFMGRDALVRRTATKNHLLASPALQPLPNSMAHFAYFVKDLVFYVLLILSPIIVGMGLGKGLDTFFSITTPLEYSSLPWTWFAMVVTLAQGLAISFLASALWMRGRPFTIFGPLVVILIGIIIGVGVFDIETVLIGLSIQTSKNLLLGVIGFGLCLLLGYLSSLLIIDDFDVSVVEKGDLFKPIYDKLSFLGRGEIRLIVAKEFVDLFRSGSIKKMVVSYSIPLAVLLGMAWLIDFAEAPIPINLLSYAPFLGFFGFNFYSWLTILDSPEFMNGLPVKVPQLIRAKVIVYFLITSWISLIFIIMMAWRLDEWISLPTGLIVMICNSIYIVALTAYRMGMRPNKAIFDSSIMIWFYLGTVAPLLMLFLLSFTQGDVALYGNWWDRVGQDGLEATSTYFDPEQMRGGYYGIIGVSGILLILSAILWKMMDRKWGDKPFEN